MPGQGFGAMQGKPQAASRHLEGQGHLVSRLITPITHIVTLGILSINLLIKSP